VIVPDCVARHPVTDCNNSRADGLARDVEADAVSRAPDGVQLVNLSDQFCDDEHCYAVVGGVIVYRDYGHLSDEYSTLLGPYLARAFDKVDSKS
jgi:SGNH domain (fused to AT3 domains)